MNRHRLQSTIIFAFISLLVGGPFAANTANCSALPFIRLTDEQGLVSNEVTSSLFDSQGYFWLGTTEGLSRYDGYNFINFRHDPRDSNSLSDNRIWSIYEDQQGILWIGTELGGLNRYDPDRESFTVYRHNPDDPESLSHNYVRKIIAAKDSKLWIGTSGGGLDLFDPTTGKFSHFVHQPDNPNSLASNVIRALQIDKQGGLWIGTRYHGLDYLSPDHQSFSHFQATPGRDQQISSNMIQSLLLSADNQLYVGTWDGGLNRFDLTTRQWTHFPKRANGLSDNAVIALLEAPDSNLWIGTVNGGLHQLNIQTSAFVNYQNQPFDPRSFPLGGIYTLNLDSRGFIWSGTWGGGVALVNPRAEKITRYQAQPNRSMSLAAGPVEGVAVDVNQTLWVGVEGGGLFALPKGETGFSSVPNEQPRKNTNEDDDIEVVYPDPVERGYMWVGYRFSGVKRLNIQTYQVKPFAIDETGNSLLNDNFVHAIFRDHENNLWVGTSAGLNRIDLMSMEMTHYQHEQSRKDSLGEGSIYVIFQDSQNNLWCGSSSGGLSRFDRKSETFTTFKHQVNDPRSLSNNTVWDIVEDQQQHLWVSTSFGINRLADLSAKREEAVFERFGSQKKVSMQFDSEQNIWLATRKGISQFSPVTKQFKQFDRPDGVLTHHSYPAKYKDSLGNLYFGGDEGLTIFHPDDLIRTGGPQKVVLTALRLSNQRVKSDGSNTILKQRIETTRALKLPYDQRIFSISYSALDFSQQDKINYRYALHGFSDNWAETSLNQVTYTNLDPGKYQFEIKASDKDGAWSQDSRLLTIEIESPPWRSHWAYLIYISVIVLLTYFYHAFQLRKIAYRNLLQLSETDQLTGLKNRHYLESRVPDDVNLSLRYYDHLIARNTPDKETQVDLVFFIIDLDFFKRVNDEFGHAAGDLVLKQTKDILKEVFRDTDHLVRWGGEEFLVVARFTKRKFAADLAERLRQQVANFPFKIGKDKILSKTCSIGYCPFPPAKHAPQAVSWQKTIELADFCLYCAKKSQRNAWVGIQSISKDLSGDNLVEQLKEQTERLVEEQLLTIATSIEPKQSLIWR